MLEIIYDGRLETNFALLVSAAFGRTAESLSVELHRIVGYNNTVMVSVQVAAGLKLGVAK